VVKKTKILYGKTMSIHDSLPIGAILDGIGIYGTVMHYALIIAYSCSTLLAFTYFWKKKRLDMDEGPKWQMMEDTHESK
jgi:hypothetical protein